MWRNIKLLNFLYKRYKTFNTNNSKYYSNKKKHTIIKKTKDNDYEVEFRREIIIFGVIAALCAIVPYVCVLKSKNTHYTMPKIDMSQDNSLCTNCNVENCADRDENINDVINLSDSTISKEDLVEFYENKIKKLENQLDDEEDLNSTMRTREILRLNLMQIKRPL